MNSNRGPNEQISFPFVNLRVGQVVAEHQSLFPEYQKYAEQLKDDVDWRKEEVEKAGLGFALPNTESLIGLLGLAERAKSKLKKAA